VARELNKISTASLRSIKPGKYGDGGGLWLEITESGAGRWYFRYMQRGRARERGLGSYPALGLAKARAKAAECRTMVVEGKDPIEEARKLREIPEFGKFALQWLETVEAGWKNEKHRLQWSSTLTKYAAPIWRLKVDAIRTDDVLRCIRPIWTDKRETASRVRGRIETVLDAAAAKGLRAGENPARWRGNLKHLLEARSKRSQKHFAALPFAQVPAFYQALIEREAVAADALRFLILTAARTGEVLGATWPEVDLETKVWTVPEARMKAGKEHRVPLTPAALAILEKMKPLAKTVGGRATEPIFPGQSGGKALSTMSLLMLLRRMNEGDDGPTWIDENGRPVTAHGFRSSFRDWVSEVTTFSGEVAEQCLAHTVGSAVVRSYKRGDVLEPRRKILDAWARYATKLPAADGSNVRELRSVAG